jgi:hypothetical protein
LIDYATRSERLRHQPLCCVCIVRLNVNPEMPKGIGVPYRCCNVETFDPWMVQRFFGQSVFAKARFQSKVFPFLNRYGDRKFPVYPE